MRANVGMSDRVRFGLLFEKKQNIEAVAIFRRASTAESVGQTAIRTGSISEQTGYAYYGEQVVASTGPAKGWLLDQQSGGLVRNSSPQKRHSRMWPLRNGNDDSRSNSETCRENIRRMT